MEHITKNNSLEAAKNRLDISGLTYVEGTKYVYDRVLNDGSVSEFINYIPLIESDGGYILRYKNLMRQYYWLINEFIPSCSYRKLCLRNGEKTWIQYNQNDVPSKCFTFSFYDGNSVIATISVASGNTATPIKPSKIGYDFRGWTTADGGTRFFNFNRPIVRDTNVYAKYKIQQMSARFALNNGEENVVLTVDYGDIPSIEAPEKEGYTFDGWDPPITPATKNARYTARYTQNIYIIRFFDIIDAEHIINHYNAQPINSGATSEYRLVKTETHTIHEQSTYYLTRPTYRHFECLEEDGYTWWIDKDGNPISASTFLDITSDVIEVYPKLTKKKYTVKFLDWDNTVITSQTVEYLDSAIAPSEEPERQNYIFTGWDTPYTSITNNTIIHATYTGDDINVTYMLPDTGGTFEVFSSVTTVFNSTAPKIEPPKSESYPKEQYGAFDGWYTDSAYTEPFDYTILLQSDTVIYGKWKTEFEVAFYNWDGTIISGDTQTGFANPIYVEYGEDVPDEALDLIIYNMMDKPGYDFLGWNKSTTGITYDVRITAVFDDTRMCLVNFINSLDESIISSTTVVFGSTILLSNYPTAPSVEHMTFKGWNGNTSQVFSDINVYAIYDYSDIEVHFVDYNKNEIGTEIVKYGQTGLTPDYIVGNVEARGYNGNEIYIVSTLRFNGQYCLIRDEFDTETGCSTPEETIITEENNRFMAQYDEIATALTICNIRFYNYDSAYWFTDTVLYGTVIDSAYSQNILDVFASDGHTPDLTVQTFYGWVDSRGNEYVIGVNELTVTNNIELYAKYKMISYNVQFYVQSNPLYYPDAIDMPIRSLETEALKNTAINRPDCSEVPERVYFETFCNGMNNRWYTDTACTVEWKFKQDVQMQPVSNPDLVTGDMILYGKYIGQEYNLRYITNGGSSIAQETYRYPMPTVRPSNPSKQNSTFIGWYTDNGTFKNEFVFGLPLNSDITIYAKWFDIPEENTILYNATADLRAYMPNMGDANLVQESCTWDVISRNGILVYDAPIDTFNIGVIDESNNITVNTEIKRNLQSITIPSQVTYVVTEQFEDCRYLKNINVSSDNDKYYSINGILYSSSLINTILVCYPQAKQGDSFDLSYRFSHNHGFNIGSKAFANCKNLKQISLNGSGDVSGSLYLIDYAFKNCTNLKEITITITGDINIPNASNNAFYGVDTEQCKLNVQCQYYSDYEAHNVWSQFDIECFGTVIYLDDNTKLTIEDDILTSQVVNNTLSVGSYTRDNIVSVEIGNNVTAISSTTFSNCVNLASVSISDSVTSIGSEAFKGCQELTNITVGSSVTEISDSMFYECLSLISVNIPDSVTKIGDDAFSSCYGLTSITIPYSVMSIGDGVFNDCSDLQSIICERTTPPTLGNDAFDDSNNCPIYVPCEYVNDYKIATNWNEYESRIQCQRNTVTTLYLNDSSSVIITYDTLTSDLISRQYSGTVVSCEIGNNVTKINNDTFRSCSSLTSITISSSVTSIGISAFEGCTNLISIEIPDSVNQISSNLCTNCSSLTSVTLPDGIKIINSNAFANCISLSSINMPSGAIQIGSNAFANCISLSSINMPSGVTRIDEGAFYNCTNLTSVTIPSAVVNIGNYAYNECHNLDSITVESTTPPTLGQHVFDGTNNCTIYVPNSSLSEYQTQWSQYLSRIEPIP